ncbi:neuropeptides capa receptor-like [Sitodiplosis mosellana]|uniref:neuropeptides capa receptor-like n=1 Tax=Sitodiplosis mosellana TaxID=263140 RepID=UPI00244444B3|nr:neuropeptides capa receptor-like [Sitodiplosis mosellana]
MHGVDSLCLDNVEKCASGDSPIYSLNKTVMLPIEERCDEPTNLTLFNCTEEEYLLYQRGDRVGNLSIAIPATIAYTFILLAGLIGNITVCIIIIRNRELHTSTNYYLFNLAIADLLYMLLGLPFEIYMFWHQYPWPFDLSFCKIRSLFSDACSYASVLTIVAFSVERYLAICHPFSSYVIASLRRVLYVIAVIWIFSLISAAPVAYYRHIRYLRYPPPDGPNMPESAVCTLNSNFKGLYEISTLVFFIIPLTVLIIMYHQIATKLNMREENHNNGQFSACAKDDTKTKQLRAKKKIVRMLVAIVITFFISWAPFHAQRLVFVYGRDWSNYYEINEMLFTIAGVFYYLSCTINPIIYNVMSHRYRAAFRRTFCCEHDTGKASVT